LESVEQLRAGSYYTYQRDGLGSTSKITGASHATINAYTYGPWGDTSSSGSLSNPFRYTGREADSGSSLYHYRARVYDPESRRFAQKDPAGMCGGTNQYAYAADEPVNKVDPSGRWSWCINLGVPCAWGFWWVKWIYWCWDAFGSCILNSAFWINTVGILACIGCLIASGWYYIVLAIFYAMLSQQWYAVAGLLAAATVGFALCCPVLPGSGVHAWPLFFQGVPVSLGSDQCQRGA
jgi:RHS repeat-associated protein